MISKSGKRLLAGDACFNISAVINDTDGRGHSTLPRHWHIPHWLGIATGLLVCCPIASTRPRLLICQEQATPGLGRASPQGQQS